MSNLVETLVEEFKEVAADNDGPDDWLGLAPDQVKALLAHIERLQEEVASWQRVHRAEYEKREALDAEIERLEAEKEKLLQEVNEAKRDRLITATLLVKAASGVIRVPMAMLRETTEDELTAEQDYSNGCLVFKATQQADKGE